MNTLILLCDNKPNRCFGVPDRNNFPVGNIDSLAKCLETRTRGSPVVSLPEACNWKSITKATAEVHGEVRERFICRSETA